MMSMKDDDAQLCAGARKSTRAGKAYHRAAARDARRERAGTGLATAGARGVRWPALLLPRASSWCEPCDRSHAKPSASTACCSMSKSSWSTCCPRTTPANGTRCERRRRAVPQLAAPPALGSRNERDKEEQLTPGSSSVSSHPCSHLGAGLLARGSVMSSHRQPAPRDPGPHLVPLR